RRNWAKVYPETHYRTIVPLKRCLRAAIQTSSCDIIGGHRAAWLSFRTGCRITPILDSLNMLRKISLLPFCGLTLAALLLSGCAATPAQPDISRGHPTVADFPLGDVRLRQIHPDVCIQVSTCQFDN